MLKRLSILISYKWRSKKAIPERSQNACLDMPKVNSSGKNCPLKFVELFYTLKFPIVSTKKYNFVNPYFLFLFLSLQNKRKLYIENIISGLITFTYEINA